MATSTGQKNKSACRKYEENRVGALLLPLLPLHDFMYGWCSACACEGMCVWCMFCVCWAAVRVQAVHWVSSVRSRCLFCLFFTVTLSLDVATYRYTPVSRGRMILHRDRTGEGGRGGSINEGILRSPILGRFFFTTGQEGQEGGGDRYPRGNYAIAPGRVFIHRGRRGVR